MVKVKAEHLRLKGSPDFAGGHGVRPEYLIFENEEKKEKFLKLSAQVHTLLRLMRQLRNAYDVLHELEKRLIKSEANNRGRDRVAESALFTQAAVSYGACFVRGSGKRPIDAFESSIRECSEHKSYMIYRDKLFGHLDKDSDVRSEPMHWTFYPNVENNLMPRKGALGYEMLYMISHQEVNRWKTYTNSLLEKVSHYTDKVTAEGNELLGHLEIQNSVQSEPTGAN